MKIELLLIDVDGTLTDGKVSYVLGENGALSELKNFNAKDGLALAVWSKKMGRKAAIITGRKSDIVALRAKELGVEFLFMGVKDKGAVARELLENLNLKKAQVAAIGDDLNDLAMFEFAKLTYAPKDCAKELRGVVSKRLKSKGADGAVREMVSDILKKEGAKNLKDYFLG